MIGWNNGSCLSSSLGGQLGLGSLGAVRAALDAFLRYRGRPRRLLPNLGLFLLLLRLGFKVGSAQSLLLFALSQVIHAEERDGATIVRLEIDLGRQGAHIPNTQLTLLLLAKDDVAEVNSVLLNAD